MAIGRKRQALAGGHAGLELPAVHDREREAAGRHGVGLRRPVLVEGDLLARDLRKRPDLLEHRRFDAAVARSVGAEEDDAVAVAPVVVGVRPAPVLLELDERRDPARLEVGPLVAEAQVGLDDAAADGLEVEWRASPRCSAVRREHLMDTWTPGR